MAEWEAEAERRRLRRVQLEAELKEIEEQEARDLARRIAASSQSDASYGAPTASSPDASRKGPTWNTGPSAALVARAPPTPPLPSSNPPPAPDPPPPLQPPSTSQAALAQKGLARLAAFIPQFREHANTRPIPTKAQVSNYLVQLQGDPNGLDTPYMLAERRFDVYALFCVVVRLGGHLQVTRHALWAPIARWLGSPAGVSTTPGELSRFYAKKLGVLEDIWDKEIVDGPGAGKAIWLRAKNDMLSPSARESLSQPLGNQPSSSRISPVPYRLSPSLGAGSSQQSQHSSHPSDNRAASGSNDTPKDLFPTLSLAPPPLHPFHLDPPRSGSRSISMTSKAQRGPRPRYSGRDRPTAAHVAAAIQPEPSTSPISPPNEYEGLLPITAREMEIALAYAHSRPNPTGRPSNSHIPPMHTPPPPVSQADGAMYGIGGNSSSSSSRNAAVNPTSEKEKGKGKEKEGSHGKGKGKMMEKEMGKVEKSSPKTVKSKGKASEGLQDVAPKMEQERGKALPVPLAHSPSHPPARPPIQPPARPPTHSPAHRHVTPSPLSSTGKGKAADLGVVIESPKIVRPDESSSDSDDPLLIPPQRARMESKGKGLACSTANAGAGESAVEMAGARVVSNAGCMSESPVKTASAGRGMLGSWSERKRKRMSAVFDLPEQEPELASAGSLVPPRTPAATGSAFTGVVRSTPDVPPPHKRAKSPLPPSVKHDRPAPTPPASASIARHHSLPFDPASSHASDSTTGTKRRKRVIHISSRGLLYSIAGVGASGLGGGLPSPAEAASPLSVLDDAASQELIEMRDLDILPGSELSIAAGPSRLSQPLETDDVLKDEEQGAEQGEGSWRGAYPDLDEETRKLWDVEIVLSRSPTPNIEALPPAPVASLPPAFGANDARQAAQPDEPVQAEADASTASGESSGEQVEMSEDEVAELLEKVNESSKAPRSGLFAVVLPISHARRAWLIKKGLYSPSKNDYIEAVGSASSIDQPASPAPPAEAAVHLSPLSEPMVSSSSTLTPPPSSSRSVHKHILPSNGPAHVIRVRSPSPLPRRFIARGGPSLPEPYPTILNPETLLDRCTPRECRWHDCDAVMACESRLAMHVERHTASGTPGLGKVQVGVTKFVFEKYKEQSTRTEAVQGEWLYRCLWRGCDEPCFVSKKKLRQHVMGKHVSRVLMCPFRDCTRTSPTIAHLTRHVIKMHDDYTSVLRPLILDIRPSIHPLPPFPATVPVSLLTTPAVTPAPRASSLYTTHRVIHKVRDMCFTGDDPVLKGWLVDDEGEGVKMKRMMEVVEPGSETPMSLLTARAEEVHAAQRGEGSGSGAGKQAAGAAVHSQSTTLTRVNENGYGHSVGKKQQTVVVELPRRSSQSTREL